MRTLSMDTIMAGGGSVGQSAAGTGLGRWGKEGLQPTWIEHEGSLLLHGVVGDGVVWDLCSGRGGDFPSVWGRGVL